MSNAFTVTDGLSGQGIRFYDPQGKPTQVFDARAKQINEAREQLVESLIQPRTGDVDASDAWEKLTSATLGASFQTSSQQPNRFSRKLVPHISFNIRKYDGRDWPLIPNRDKSGSDGWVEVDLDPHNLGTYTDTFRYATGDGSVSNLDTYVNNATAKMGGYVRGMNMSPGNKELLIAHAESGYWWTYIPTKDCQLEIQGEVIETYSRHTRDLVDEGMFFAPQVSNVHLQQQNFLTVGYFLDDSSSLANYGKVMTDVGPSSSYSGDGSHSNSSAGPYGGVNAVGFPDVDDVVRNGNRTLLFKSRPSVAAHKGVPTYCFFGAQASFHADLDDVKATIRQGATWLVHNLKMVEVA